MGVPTYRSPISVIKPKPSKMTKNKLREKKPASYLARAYPIGFVIRVPVAIVAEAIDDQYPAAALSHLEPHAHVQAARV